MGLHVLKRDGTAKARLCVQGCTLESDVDYDQTFSSTLRYSSARALFALAARRGCHVRSIDYVAAYLQGEFVEGEARCTAACRWATRRTTATATLTSSGS